MRLIVVVHKVEDFFENLLEEIADSLGDLISRDEDGMDKKFQVHDSYDIGGIFKAVGVKVADDRYLDRMSSLPDVTSIIPDDEIQFDLPYAEKRKIDKRYYIVSKHPPYFCYPDAHATCISVIASCCFAKLVLPKQLCREQNHVPSISCSRANALFVFSQYQRVVIYHLTNLYRHQP